MRLSSAGEDLFGPNQAAVLRVLARRARPATGLEVARLAQASPSSTRRILDHLRDVGLVSAEPSGRAIVYLANRRHVLWEPVEAILSATSRVERSISETVERNLGDGATVAVFGSVARNQSTAESDFDVALVVDDAVDDALRERVVDELTEQIEALTGNPAQVVEVTRSQLGVMTRAGDPLISSWAAEAHTLGGPDLAGLIAGAA